MAGLTQALGYMDSGALVGAWDNLSASNRPAFLVSTEPTVYISGHLISRMDLKGTTEVRRLLNRYVEKFRHWLPLGDSR